jgi:hypothetical protein
MSRTTTSTVSLTVSVSQSDVSTGKVYSNSTTFSNSFSLSNGTGVQEVDAVWSESGILAASGSYTIDTTSLSQSIFGAVQTVDFSGGSIKVCAIQNKSTDLSAYFTIMATGGNGFTELFDGKTGSFNCYSQGPYIYTNIGSGTPVNGSNKNITLKDSGYGSIYEIIIVGVTG